jgi:hypothetical protein
MFLAGAEIFSICSHVETRYVAYPAACPMVVGQGEANHTFPAFAHVKMSAG